jgi:DMSO/TMAO reductase YedYZ molybdopterin-dependent catalytic subunit
VLGDRPLVAETPGKPARRRHHADREILHPQQRQDSGGGEGRGCLEDRHRRRGREQQVELSLGELKSKYKPVTRRMVLECGGNGRAAFSPPARGNQWTNGGAGCAEWTGVAARRCAESGGSEAERESTPRTIRPTCIFRATPASPASRAACASRRRWILYDDRVGDERAAAAQHPRRAGAPRRSGLAGSASQKWLTRINIRDKEHDGPGMTEFSYRVAIKPMVPGDKADAKNWRILESMPVRSIITNPANGTRLAAGTNELKLRGASWAGDLSVKAVDVSTDFGATWQRAKLDKPKNKYDWQRWTASVKLPSDGYYEVWVRATDSSGKMQPHIAGNWNPQGYGGNAMHRVAVLVG